MPQWSRWMVHLIKHSVSKERKWAIFCQTLKNPDLLEYRLLPSSFTLLIRICRPWIRVSFWTGWYCLPPQAPAAASCRGSHWQSVYLAVPLPAKPTSSQDLWLILSSLSHAAFFEHELYIQFIWHTCCFVILDHVPLCLLLDIIWFMFCMLLCMHKHEYLVL